MKSYTMFALCFLFGVQVFSQKTVKSCMDYNPDRDLSGFRTVVLASTDPFMQRELWPQYARIANNILKTSQNEAVRNFIVTPDYEGMYWLMNHTSEYEWSYFKQEDFYNGTSTNGRLVFKPVIGRESSWAVLEVGDVSGVYAKIKCCNPQEPKRPPTIRSAPIKKPEPQQQPIQDDEWQYRPTQSSQSLLTDQNPPIQAEERVNLNIVGVKRVPDWGKIATIGSFSVGLVGLTTLGYLLFSGKDNIITEFGSRVTNGSHQSGQ